MKKILMHAPEEGSGCTYYRNTLPLLHCYRDLAAQGIELTVQTQILDLDLAEVYVLQRVVPDSFLPHLLKLKEAGARLIFQTDDDLWNLPSWSPAAGKLTYSDREATTVALDIVDEIITSTEPLSQMINKPGKTTVLPNLIDLAAYHPRNSDFDQYRTHDEMVRILWAGSNSHDGDLEQIVNPVLRLIEKHKQKVQFVFFGYLPTGLADFVRFPATDVACLKPKDPSQILYIPPAPHRFYHDILTALRPDIGIAPLADCLFNLSKSAIKSLEYTMAGAAFVGTLLPPYAWVTPELGRLVIPGDEEDWFLALDGLIENPALRQSLVCKALTEMQKKHTWQSPSRELWLSAFAKMCGGGI